MPTKLSKAAIARAIAHITAYGDTDVFPHLYELAFLKDRPDQITDILADVDLDSHVPQQAIEVLSPKSRYGFRVVHQLSFVDTILFTAAVVSIGDDLEKLKPPPGGFGPFSYRFVTGDDASLFETGHNYRDWLEWQKANIPEETALVIITDIADFYQRIYLHRIENTLDSGTAQKGLKRYIEKTIKSIRSRQSHAIPVGGSAARIIAEAVLTDSDAALLSEQLCFTRFVDDYRIFVPKGENPYDALAFLAEQLFQAEGLTLNGQKTRIIGVAE